MALRLISMTLSENLFQNRITSIVIDLQDFRIVVGRIGCDEILTVVK